MATQKTHKPRTNFPDYDKAAASIDEGLERQIKSLKSKLKQSQEAYESKSLELDRLRASSSWRKSVSDEELMFVTQQHEKQMAGVMKGQTERHQALRRNVLSVPDQVAFSLKRCNTVDELHALLMAALIEALAK